MVRVRLHSGEQPAVPGVLSIRGSHLYWRAPQADHPDQRTACPAGLPAREGRIRLHRHRLGQRAHFTGNQQVLKRFSVSPRDTQVSPFSRIMPNHNRA